MFEDYCSHFSIFGHQTAVDVFDVLKNFIDFGVLGPTSVLNSVKSAKPVSARLSRISV